MSPEIPPPPLPLLLPICLYLFLLFCSRILLLFLFIVIRKWKNFLFFLQRSYFVGKLSFVGAKLYHIACWLAIREPCLRRKIPAQNRIHGAINLIQYTCIVDLLLISFENYQICKLKRIFFNLIFLQMI